MELRHLQDVLTEPLSQFGMAATAHLTVFGLGLVSAGLGGRVEYGWKEI